MNFNDVWQRPRTGTTRDERAQILVIVGVGLIAMIALVGLVIDGGVAWSQQRQTQNGSDAMAVAGAPVRAEQVAGVPRADGDVGCAIERAALTNDVATPTATYTDINGNELSPSVTVGACSPGGGAAIPAN